MQPLINFIWLYLELLQPENKPTGAKSSNGSQSSPIHRDDVSHVGALYYETVREGRSVLIFCPSKALTSLFSRFEFDSALNELHWCLVHSTGLVRETRSAAVRLSRPLLVSRSRLQTGRRRRADRRTAR